MELKTFDQALTEAKEKQEKDAKEYKIGKAQSYFNKDWSMDKGHGYKELKNGKVSKADGFVAGENSFIIKKDKTKKFGKVEAFLAVDDELDMFTIYIDKDGNLYTDQDEKVGLYRKILK